MVDEYGVASSPTGPGAPLGREPVCELLRLDTDDPSAPKAPTTRASCRRGRRASSPTGARPGAPGTPWLRREVLGDVAEDGAARSPYRVVAAGLFAGAQILNFCGQIGLLAAVVPPLDHQDHDCDGQATITVPSAARIARVMPFTALHTRWRYRRSASEGCPVRLAEMLALESLEAVRGQHREAVAVDTELAPPGTDRRTGTKLAPGRALIVCQGAARGQPQLRHRCDSHHAIASGIVPSLLTARRPSENYRGGRLKALALLQSQSL